jgi:hypothetical protein
MVFRKIYAQFIRFMKRYDIFGFLRKTDLEFELKQNHPLLTILTIRAMPIRLMVKIGARPMILRRPLREASLLKAQALLPGSAFGLG